MDTKKQKLLLEYLVSSSDTFALCSGIVKSDYFDPEFRTSVKFIKNYYDQYHTTPNPDQIEAETAIKLSTQEVTKDQVIYCADEIEKFCKRKAIEKAVISAPPLILEENYGEVEKNIRDAVMVSLNRNLGLRYFDDPAARLKRMLESNQTEATGWTEVDELLFGGISRKEMILFAANSGGGKSITLANLSMNFIQKGLNALYISLELSEDVVAQRFDTMITGISRKEWKAHTTEICTRLAGEKEKSGVLDIIHMPSGTTANEIRAYLKEYYLHYDMMPDLLVCDYLDKMGPNEKVSADNVFEKDKRCSEQLRDIGVEHNMFVATASQLNRGAVNATRHDHSHIAGGISKINECDIFITVVMNDAMKAAGECMFSFQKTRNSDGDGKTVYLKWNPTFLRITNPDGKAPDGGLNFKPKSKVAELLGEDEPKGGSSLLDLMSSTS